MAIQAVIVAGGRGERMRPATDAVPKPMLPVAGKPLLGHQLSWLRASGITEAFLCLGYKAEGISEYFGDGSSWGVRLRYQIESAPRGTAGCVRDLGLEIPGDLLVVYGDLFIDMDCRRLLDFHNGHSGAATLVVRPSDHPLDSDLVRTADDRILSLYRAKPGESFDNLACAAVWVVRPRLLEFVPLDKPSDFGRDIFPQALDAGEILMAYRTQEEIFDLGTPARIEAFEHRRTASGRAVPARGSGRWAVFLDRDGVLSEEKGLVSCPEDLKLISGAAAAVRRLREAGAVVLIATNQPVVARGLVDEAGLGRIHERLEFLLAESGAKLDAIYYCPHHPELGHPEASDPRYRRDCECRKPKPGMLLAAAERFGLDLQRSYFVGDSTRDIQTARNAGCGAVLVRTGNGGRDGLFNVLPDVVVDDAVAAAEWIVDRVQARA